MLNNRLSRTDLTKDQNETIEFIKRNPKCAVWKTMGGGKTVSSLTGFSDLYDSLDSRRMLVTAPKRVARDVWDEELDTWSHLHGLTISKIVGTRQQRLAALKVPADIHTVNRENIAWLLSGYIEETSRSKFRQIRKWPWDMLTLDEAQSFRSPGAKRTKAVHRISSFGLCDRVVELTGTPAPKGYEHLWAQIYALDQGARLGNTQQAYLDRWFNPPPDWGFRWTLKDGAKEQIQSALKDIVLAFPDTGTVVPVNPVSVKLPSAILQRYRKFAREELLRIGDHNITAANAGVLSNKLLQFASGAVYAKDKSYATVHDEKLKAVYDLLDELTWAGPVVIGYNFRHEIDRLEPVLNKYCRSGQKWSVLNSAKQLGAFQRGLLDVGIIHPASGGHGLNALYKGGAKNLIWMGPNPDLELFLQLNARLTGGHRWSEGVGLHALIADNTIDEDYMTMLKQKDVDQRGLVQALRGRV